MNGVAHKKDCFISYMLTICDQKSEKVFTSLQPRYEGCLVLNESLMTSLALNATYYSYSKYDISLRESIYVSVSL